MKYIRKVRKLIYNILDNYYQQDNSDYYYYSLDLINYENEFECLVNEKKIGIYSSINENEILIIFKLLEMLYERNYKFIIEIYNKFTFDININFNESLDDTDFWIKLFRKFFDINKINIQKYNNIPITLKNYKTRKNVKYYNIKDIKEKFF